MLRRLLRQWESPPTWLLLMLTLVTVQARLLPLLPPPAALRLAGLGLITLGLGLIALAALQFRRHATTILPREAPLRLIETGLYRLSRNPIYLGDALILAGFALRADLAALLWLPVFVAILTRRFIRGEEAVLRATFGADFDRYVRHVRRWL